MSSVMSQPEVPPIEGIREGSLRRFNYLVRLDRELAMLHRAHDVSRRYVLCVGIVTSHSGAVCGVQRAGGRRRGAEMDCLIT